MITKTKVKLFTALAIFALGLGWIALGDIDINNAYAEEDPGTSSIFVSPMTQKIVLMPGETYSGSIKVANSNNSTADLHYKAEIGSYGRKKTENSKDYYSTVDVNEVTGYNAIMEWINLEKTTGTVAPNDTDILNFTIKVPGNAPAGAQYASILVYEDDSQKNSSKNNGANITSKYQLASAILANVAGETVERGSIKENNMPTMLTNNKLEATSMVRNDGNIYTDATYTLQVWPMFSDEEICTNEEKAESTTVLPDTERYHVQSCTLPAVGIFKAKQVVKIFSEESVLEKTIFVCPIWLMVLVLIVIVAIIVGIVIYIKKRKSAKSTD